MCLWWVSVAWNCLFSPGTDTDFRDLNTNGLKRRQKWNFRLDTCFLFPISVSVVDAGNSLIMKILKWKHFTFSIVSGCVILLSLGCDKTSHWLEKNDYKNSVEFLEKEELKSNESEVQFRLQSEWVTWGNMNMCVAVTVIINRWLDSGSRHCIKPWRYAFYVPLISISHLFPFTSLHFITVGNGNENEI